MAAIYIALALLLLALLSVPFWVALFRAARMRRTPGLIPTVYVLLSITYGIAIIHIDALKDLFIFALSVGYLGAAKLFTEAFFLKFYWAFFSAAIIFMASLFLLSKSRGIWRILICLPLGALLFYVPTHLQSLASTRQIEHQTETMQFDCYRISPFWESMAYKWGSPEQHHGWARRGDAFYIWSYRANAWLPAEDDYISSLLYQKSVQHCPNQATSD